MKYEMIRELKAMLGDTYSVEATHTARSITVELMDNNGGANVTITLNDNGSEMRLPVFISKDNETKVTNIQNLLNKVFKEVKLMNATYKHTFDDLVWLMGW